MTVLVFTLVVLAASIGAGLLGALTGLGGGVIVTPVLTLFLHVDIRYAIGASLVSVIATSSGAASAFVREGYTNIRVGMFLEVATTLGAVAGAALAAHVPTRILTFVFGLVLLQSAWQTGRGVHEPDQRLPDDPLAERLKLHGQYESPDGPVAYMAHRVKLGFALMFGAGTISGLLGIGSGSLKVIAMDNAMRLPFKVSTATSNFMIGVTAAASAGIYLSRGYLDPGIVMPVVLGVLAGSVIGARFLPRLSAHRLRALFAVVVGVVAIQMLYHAWRVS